MANYGTDSSNSGEGVGGLIGGAVLRAALPPGAVPSWDGLDRCLQAFDCPLFHIDLPDPHRWYSSIRKAFGFKQIVHAGGCLDDVCSK